MDEISPERAVAQRCFPILLIGDGDDRTLPLRHVRRIYASAIGPKQLWIVPNAPHAMGFGTEPAKYEEHVLAFFAECAASQLKFGPSHEAARGTVRRASRVLQQRHKPKIHVKLLVAVKERGSRIVREKIRFHLLSRRHHHNILQNSRWSASRQISKAQTNAGAGAPDALRRFDCRTPACIAGPRSPKLDRSSETIFR